MPELWDSIKKVLGIGIAEPNATVASTPDDLSGFDREAELQRKREVWSALQ